MNGACDRFLEDLPLYAEGELEAPEERLLRLHLDHCPDCREWLESYDAFTREIFEAEPLGSGTKPGRNFIEKVMAGVERVDSLRWRARLLRIAAAALFLASLAAGGVFWLASGRGGIPRSSGAPRIAAVEVAPAAEKAAGSGLRFPDLWVMDPEGEKKAGLVGNLETVLYSGEPVERETGDLREFLILKALLGAFREDVQSPASDFDLALVPEEGGGGGAIPARPVALPMRVPERDIEASARLRIRSPSVRYRIFWIGKRELPLHVNPLLGPSGNESPVRNLPLVPPDRPIGFLPAVPERY